MNTLILQNNHIKKIFFFIVVSFLLFYLFRLYYQDQYPDWISYKNIYLDQNDILRTDGYDYMYILIMDISSFFNLQYEYFRLVILGLISFVFIKSLLRYNLNVIIFFTLLNFIFIFFQIREALAISLLYYALSKTNKKKIFLLNLTALFFHFTSIIFVLLAKQKAKNIIIIFFFFLISLTVLYNFYYNTIYEYLDLHYSHNITEIDSKDIIYSKYFFISPVLYLALVLRVNTKDFLKYLFIFLLIFSITFPIVFPFLKISNVFFNSFYRFVVFYLSFMILKKRFTPNVLSYVIILLILMKDLISSQILYDN